MSEHAQNNVRGRVEIACLSGIFKNHIINMVAKQLEHFLSAKRPLSAIFKSRPTNEVIRHKHQDHVFAKIMLEQKSDLEKIRLRLTNVRSETTMKKNH